MTLVQWDREPRYLCPPEELVIGLAVFPLISVNGFGLTAYLTGRSPNELLFDTARFGLYGAALALVAVPMLGAALPNQAAPVLASVIAIAVASSSALVGIFLCRRVGLRWYE